MLHIQTIICTKTYSHLEEIRTKKLGGKSDMRGGGTAFPNKKKIDTGTIGKWRRTKRESRAKRRNGFEWKPNKKSKSEPNWCFQCRHTYRISRMHARKMAPNMLANQVESLDLGQMRTVLHNQKAESATCSQRYHITCMEDVFEQN